MELCRVTKLLAVLTTAVALCLASPNALAGAGVCTNCLSCPGDLTACFPGGTPMSACTDLGCVGGDTSTPCNELPECPLTEAGQCSDGINNDAWQNGDTDCADAACASDPACTGVPAASTWGLAALSLVLLAAGTIAIANRPTRRQQASH